MLTVEQANTTKSFEEKKREFEIKVSNREVFTKEEWEFFGYKTDLLNLKKENNSKPLK